MQLDQFIKPVFKILKTIPSGYVTTYGRLAKLAGVPSPRNIGWILRQNNQPDDIPCYKVVMTNGRLAAGYKFGGSSAQQTRLEQDGLIFEGGKIKSFASKQF
jgi:methylated-DNA-protein-cysteine methyltransferase-like protein